MKNKLTIIIVVMLIIWGFTGTAFSAPVTKPKINMASANYFPTVMDKVIVAALDRLGYNANIYYMAPAYGIEEANSGRFDGYAQWGAGLQAQNRNLVMVDEGLFDYKVLVCAVKENITYNRPEDLRRYRVGYEFDRPFISGFLPGNVNAREMEDNDDVWVMLSADEIDVGLIVTHELDKLNIPSHIRIIGELNSKPIASYTYLNRKYADLAPQLAAIYREMKEDGSIERILAQGITFDTRNPASVLKVLHIHAGSPNAILAKELIEGRDDGLAANFSKFETLDFYLDNTARGDRIFWERFYNTLRAYVVKRNFDLVMVDDPEALEFAQLYYRNLFWNLPVIFSGVDINDVPGDAFRNFTGIVENYGTQETVSEMIKLFPYVSEIYIVTDESDTSQAWREHVLNQLQFLPAIENGRIKISFNAADKPIVLADLIQQVADLENSTLILLGPYLQKSDVKNICDAAQVPIFGMFEDNNNLGQIGGYMTDYAQRGQNMADIAAEIFIKGKAPRDIPVISDSTNKWVFNYNALQAYNIDATLLPEGSVIINKPISFYDEYRDTIHLYIMVLAFMVVVIIILLSLAFRLFRMNSKLHTTEELLAQEEKTRHEQRKLLEYIARTRVAYMEFDLGYRVTAWNQAAEDLFGYLEDEIFGKNFIDYIIPDTEKPAVDEVFNSVFAGEHESDSIPMQNFNRDGDILYCEWFVTAIYDENQAVAGLSAQAVDLTYRYNLENLLEQERTLLDRILVGIPDSIYYKDGDGVYLMCNPSFESFVGKTKEEIIGRNDYDLFAKETAESFRNHDYLAINSKGIYNNEEVVISSGNHKEILHTSRIPLYDDQGNGSGLIGISHNITNRVMMERKLKQVQKHLKKTLDTAPVAYIVSVDGAVVEANDYAKINLGVEIGKPATDYYRSTDERKKYMAKLDEKGSFTGETFLLKLKSGELRHFLVNGSFTVHNGKIGIAIWGVDIEDKETTNKMLRDTQKDLEKVINSLPLPMVIVGVDMRTIAYGNMAFLNKFGLKNLKEAQKMTLYDISDVPETSYESFEMYASEIFSIGQDQGFEWTYKISGGNKFEAVNIANLMMFKGHPVFSVIIRDITDEKQRMLLMQEAVDAANEANRVKSKFLANMSHEIRTPLNAIIGLSALELKKQHSEEINETYMKINMSAKILLHIIEDILDYSKLEVDKIEIIANVFPLEELVQNAILVTELRLENKPVELLVDFDFDLPYFISADNIKLWQILKNLLDNACKFTDNGSVTLRVSAAPEVPLPAHRANAVNIMFEIIDTGVGLTEDQMNRIFVPFEQFHNQSHSQHTGSGLGMAIVKRLIENMDGEMGIDSELGRGTNMHFVLPFDLTEDTDSVIEKIRQNDFFVGKRVLICDDNEISLRVINSLMEAVGAKTTTTTNSEDAVKAYQKANVSNDSYDIVLLDYSLPERDGIETARIMLNNNRRISSKAMMLLMFNSYSSAANQQSLKDLGIKDIINKPVIPSVFINKIDKYDGNYSSYEQSVENAKYPNAKVLLVEDNDINREVGVGLLETFDIYPDTAVDGLKAVEAAQNKLYDLILMDIRMPHMDGYEATRTIREFEDETLRNVPIIGLSANTQAEDIKYCLSIGMNGYVTKPVSLEDLNDVFREHLASSAVSEKPAVVAAAIEENEELPEPVLAAAVSIEENMALLEPLLENAAVTAQADEAADEAGADPACVLGSEDGDGTVADSVGDEPENGATDMTAQDQPPEAPAGDLAAETADKPVDAEAADNYVLMETEVPADTELLREDTNQPEVAIKDSPDDGSPADDMPEATGAAENAALEEPEAESETVTEAKSDDDRDAELEEVEAGALDSATMATLADMYMAVQVAEAEDAVSMVLGEDAESSPANLYVAEMAALAEGKPGDETGLGFEYPGDAEFMYNAEVGLGGEAADAAEDDLSESRYETQLLLDEALEDDGLKP